MRISTAAGIGSAASLLVGIGVPIAFPNADPLVGQALLAAAGLLFALMVGLWWPRRGAQETTGTVQTTHGSQSPNYGRVEGGVHNYYGPPNPAEKQERKSPYGLGARIVDGDTGRALAQMLESDDLSHLLRRPNTAEVVLRKMREQRQRCPEMPIHIALHWIATRIGDKDKANGFPKARQQFRQRAREGQVDAWGQRQIPPQHMQDNRRKGVWSPIDPDHWEDHALHPRAANKDAQEEPHTEEEETGRISDRYWSLKVHEDDINHRWPKPQRTTNDGKP